jgi:hypothetical protein
VREEGGERAFRKYDEIAALRRRLLEERDHSRDGARTAFRAGDRAELRGADGDDARH